MFFIGEKHVVMSERRTLVPEARVLLSPLPELGAWQSEYQTLGHVLQIVGWFSLQIVGVLNNFLSSIAAIFHFRLRFRGMPEN